ncbi:MAG: hypothetical protein NT154_17460 [Verrucomicrobia bacterium]|nr:hypothetical protein [Verrucomicrobiota bacterium]
MNSKKPAAASNWWRLSPLALVLACSSILLGTAGLLVLSSCATTPKGLAREEAIQHAASNTVAFLQPVAAALPAPSGQILESVLAAGGALLALWATHIHRSLAEIKKREDPAGQPAATGPPKTS